MDSIFSEILEEELRDIILYDLSQQSPRGSAFANISQILDTYALSIPNERLETTLEALRTEFYIRRDPVNSLSISITENGIRYVNEVVKQKVQEIELVDQLRIKSLISSHFNPLEFNLEEQSDGFQVRYYPDSEISQYTFTAFRRRNAYYFLLSNPPIQLYRRSDRSAIYKAFEQWLITLKSLSKEKAVDIINALSTQLNDQRLIDQGLRLVGLLGHILTKQQDGSVPLLHYSITFRNGKKKDNLYTTSAERERLQGREPVLNGPIGFVFSTSRPRTILLQRYHHGQNLDHLYVTKLLASNSPSGYNDERGDNPIYIYESEEPGTTALYLYTTSRNLKWLTPLETESRPTNIKSDSMPEGKVPDLGGAEGVLLIEGGTRFNFRNEGLTAILNVESQAKIFKMLIASIPPSETGTLLGIFGRWGRGKTFFWKELRKLLPPKSDNLKDPIYRTVEFHAWKYQDTPASWAYLYEVFAEKFYSEPRNLWCLSRKKWALKLINVFLLNKTRNGWWLLLKSILVAVFSFIWYFLIDLPDKWNLLEQLINFIGVPTTIGFVFFYHSYKGTAKDIFRKYFSETSFKGLLGIQAEIQKEFIHLLKAWIPENSKMRIVLFVDDIDRCKEERIVDVIDSLKVMMDDAFISKRVVVIAAIDETVLKRGVKRKYASMIKEDPSLHEPNDKKTMLDHVCREYLDKLFLIGFKLGDLSAQDRIDFMRTLVKDYTYYRNDSKKDSKFDSQREKQSESISPIASTGNQQADFETAYRDEVKNFIALQPAEDYELMDYEIEHLISSVIRFKEATPRAIRIFYFRYLLAKFFKDLILKQETEQYAEWNFNGKKKAILPYLIIDYTFFKQHKDLSLELIRAEASEKTITVNVLDREFTLSKELYITILKIVEIVVPY